MKWFILILLFNPFQQLFSQCNDSIVINQNTDNNTFTNIRSNSVTYYYYHLDSGSVTTVSQTFSNGSWAPASTSTYTYNRTDSIVNGTGQLIELLTMEGTGTGWNPKSTLRYTYNAFGSRTSEAYLQWNVSAWDSSGLTLWNFDAQNRLVSYENYVFNSGIRKKESRKDIIYNSGHEDSVIIYHGDTSNLWSNQEMYVFYYTGLLRTSAEIFRADSTGSWVSSGIFNYFLNASSKWVIEYQVLTPVFISATNLSDTLTQQLDTFENSVYSRMWHYTAIDEAYMDQYYNDVINSKFVNLQYRSSNMVSWIVPPNWDVLDRTYVETNTYDSVPALIHRTEWGSCTNPCGSVADYVYDAYGRVLHYVYDWESMVNEIFRMDDWEYLDSAAVSILIPSWENNLEVCPGDSVQPFILTSDACNQVHYQWYPSSGLSSDTIVDPYITVNVTTTYTVVAYDNTGLSDTAYLTILPQYPNSQISIDSFYCDGSAMLSMNIWQATYNWFLNDVSTQVNNHRQFYALTPGNYFCMGTYVAGSQNQYVCTFSSDTVTLAALSAVIAISNDTIFSLSQGVTYEWYADSTLIPMATDSFIIAGQEGDYYALITDSNGCVRSSNIVNYTIINVPHISPNVISISINESFLSISNLSEREYSVSVYDATGRLFMNEISGEKNNVMDLSSYHSGVYLVVVEQEGRMMTKKVVLH